MSHALSPFDWIVYISWHRYYCLVARACETTWSMLSKLVLLGVPSVEFSCKIQLYILNSRKDRETKFRTINTFRVRRRKPLKKSRDENEAESVVVSETIAVVRTKLNPKSWRVQLQRNSNILDLHLKKQTIFLRILRVVRVMTAFW